MIFVYDPRFTISCCNIDISYKQRNFVFPVQAFPHLFCKFIDIPADADPFRLSLKARKRISVVHICMDKTSFPGCRICIRKCIPATGIRPSVFGGGSQEAVGQPFCRSAKEEERRRRIPADEFVLDIFVFSVINIARLKGKCNSG